MSATLDFLERVLPPEGDHWYVAALFAGERVNHRWFKTRVELAACLLEADRSGATAYHACGTFRSRDGGRKAANSAGAQSFWCDIDAGAGKQYATTDDARAAVLAFGAAIRLPAPLFVRSGFGLHCYWPLAVALDPAPWRRYAAGLAAALRRHGIRHERTTDLASLLRSPGTHNRKAATPRLVVAEAFTGPYQLQQFTSLLDEQQVPHTPTINGHSIAARLGNIAASRPRSSRQVVAGCLQLNAPATNSRGYVPQSLWYAGLGVFAFIELDGDEAAHQWSSDDDRYTFAETQSKLDQARTLSGATTCAHLHALEPRTCEACPHWGKIKSPIALATLTPEQEKPGPPRDSIELPELPNDYQWRDGSLCRIYENKNGEDAALVISQHPIYLASIHTYESKDEFAYRFNQLIPTRGWHAIVLSASELRSAAGNSQLSRYGGNVRDYGEFHKYAVAAVDVQYQGQPLSALYEQFGWKDNDTSFLYGLNLYTPQGVTPVIGDKNVVTRTGTKETFVGPCQGGDLHVWSGTCNKLFAAGCESQSVALLAAFGAVFLRFLSRDEGGAVLSFVTHASARGKTTALAAALSVWGRRQGLGLENIESDISKGATLASIGNLPLFFDEFDTRDPALVHEFVQIFTNGRDKRRLNRNGEIKDSGLQWQTTLLTASNSSLADSIRAAGNPALANRIFELGTEIPPALRSEFAGDALKDTLRQHSGHAGAKFLAALVQPANLAQARHDLDKYFKQMWQVTGLPEQYRFWIRLAASVAVAGEIVKGIGLLEFSPARILDWLVKQMQERAGYGQEDEQDHGDQDDGWTLTALGQFILEKSAGSQIVVEGPFFPGQSGVPVLIKPTREIVMRAERSNGRIYIAKNALRAWAIPAGHNLYDLLHGLVRQGVCLNLSKNVTLGAGTDYGGTRVTCIEIDGRHPALTGLEVNPKQNVLPLRASDPNNDNSLGGMEETY